MMYLLFSLAAWACPPTQPAIDRARAAFDDAEVDQAASILATALDELGCQTQVVERDTLLALYRLDALVALARADDRRAVESTMRAVTVDPLAVPSIDYGPELIELHRSWAGRLSDKQADVTVMGGGKVYVDGQPLTHGQRMRITRGYHLVQIVADDGVTSVVDVLDGNRAVVTGQPSPEGDGPDADADTGDGGAIGPRPPAPAAADTGTPPRPVPRRWRPAALWIAGGALAVTGGTLATVATLQERRFHQRQYDDFRQVDADAIRIRTLYVAGYATAAVGVGALATVTVGLPPKRR